MFQIFKRKPLYYAEKRRLIKWIDQRYLLPLEAPAVVACWILDTNFWADSCTWDDSETWND